MTNTHADLCIGFLFVCGTRELVRTGNVDIVTAHLRKSGFRVKLHTNIEPQPTFEW